MKVKLNEGNIIDEFNDAKKVNLDGKSKEKQEDIIVDALDEALDVAEDYKDKLESGEDVEPDWPNVLLIGGAGTGKTARVNAWGKSRGIRIWTKSAAELDKLDIGGVQTPIKTEDGTVVAARLAPVEFDVLDDPKTVLFLDELNRAQLNVRTSLLTLINTHRVVDPKAPNGLKTLDFLFTVAAINPSGYSTGYQTYDLDPAELTRFRRVEVRPEKAVTFRYILSNIDKNIKFYTNKLKTIDETDPKYERYTRLLNKWTNTQRLVQHLEKKPEFDFTNEFDTDKIEQYFDDPSYNKLLTSARTFESLLNIFNGTSTDFIKKFPQFCNNLDLPMAQKALADYQDVVLNDVDDKANQAIKGYQRKTNSDRARARRG